MTTAICKRCSHCRGSMASDHAENFLCAKHPADVRTCPVSGIVTYIMSNGDRNRHLRWDYCYLHNSGECKDFVWRGVLGLNTLLQILRGG